MPRPLWKRDWFWLVLLPEVFMGAVFAVALLLWLL